MTQRELETAYGEVSKKKKEFWDERSLLTTEKLLNLVKQIKPKFLSDEDKEMLNYLRDYLYIEASFVVSSRQDMELYEATDIVDFFDKVHKIDKKLQESEDMFIFKQEYVNKAQNVLIEVLQNQIKREFTELFNYKLFEDGIC